MAAKRKTHSISEKVNIIREVEKNPNVKVAEMARRLGMATSSLNSIIKQKSCILEEEGKCGSTSKKRKNMKCSPFEEMEKILFEWFGGARAENIPVDGGLLKEKATQIALRLGMNDFKASNGWLDRFKKRHGITCRAVCGESGQVNDENVSHWKDETLPFLLDGYKMKDVYNVDETGLFYHLMPSKTLSIKGEPCHGGKHSKDRLTVLLCCNADGSDKLQPIVIGKSAKPRAFKRAVTLPCKYYSNKSAWMTTELFTKFLQAFDARMGATNRKVILFMDMCPAHPLQQPFLRNVKVHFFPPNCTSKLQPLDLGVIHSFKVKYRKALVRKAIASIDQRKNIKVNILQSMHMLTAAWNSVSTETISNCFCKAGFMRHSIPEVNGEECIEEEEWRELCSDPSINFKDYATVDDNVDTTGTLSVDVMCLNKMEEEEEEEEDDDEDDDDGKPTFSEAVASLDIVRKYIQTFEVDEAVLARVNSLERDLLNLHRPKKQTTLLEFFRK